MTKIFTFRAKLTMRGTVSIEAKTIEEARAKRAALLEGEADGIYSERAHINLEKDTREVFIDAMGYEDKTAESREHEAGTYEIHTPRENAQANAQALKELKATNSRKTTTL